ncbi:MAG TPA: NAD-dependent epimerase/dehydratase family protein [Usitatibacteraceae bacterium]|nr:NAD-dependent epimerase/dehydratase family protein [Usitatibacteraceae bacterium]
MPDLFRLPLDPDFPVPRKALVTGAGGFVGSALVARLGPHAGLALGGDGWRDAIAGADFREATVVHLAARVHESRGEAAAFERDNTVKTRVLAEAAAAGGAARFVFASTVKVHGEETGAATFGPDSPPAPQDPYARSKWLAEEALRDIASRTGLPVVIVRIPLTYGPGVGGNFRDLLRLADSATPLPLAAIRNRRSLVHVRDLVEALLLAAGHPKAPGRAFIAAHPVPVSTPELVTALRSALGRPARLFPVPAFALEVAATVAGLRDRMRRLTRSLEADPATLMATLGWSPQVGLAAGVEDTVAAWREGAKG